MERGLFIIMLKFPLAGIRLYTFYGVGKPAFLKNTIHRQARVLGKEKWIDLFYWLYLLTFLLTGKQPGNGAK